MDRTEAKAVLRTVRLAPQKSRLVIDLIRGKKVGDAKSILANQTQKSARIIEKVLNSAISNAVNNFNMKEEDLYVKACYIDEGVVLKRAKMDSRGHIGRNDHKTSHITIIVSNLNK